MTLTYLWRGPLDNTELNTLHAEAFVTRVFSNEEWDWSTQLSKHSLGWVSARDGEKLVGFVNVIGDGSVHAWILDLMVADTHRRGGVGRQLVELARDSATAAGCEWLHVDFEEDLASFYLDACGFRRTSAGLIDLTT